MSTVGIRELKNRLTAYLCKTKQGEEIVVTERGKPIALIQPIESAHQIKSHEAKLAKLAARGLVTLPDGRRLKKFRPATVTDKPTSQVILEDRR